MKKIHLMRKTQYYFQNINKKYKLEITLKEIEDKKSKKDKKLEEEDVLDEEDMSSIDPYTAVNALLFGKSGLDSDKANKKMEKLLKKAEDATGGKRYSEALTWLRQAKRLAMPDKQKEIDVKIAEVQKKASEGSLFGAEPVMPEPQPAQVIQPVAPQPVPGHAPRYQGGEQIRMFAPEQPSRQSPHQISRSVQGTRPQQVPHGQVASRPGSDGTPAGCQQPVNRPQTIQFHQPVQMPQSQVYDGQWLQPVLSQPQTASTQTVPDNKGENEYGARAQDMGQYGFDKDDEHDRELLREDPYAEYLDFPEEYRMKDEAQMEMICC